MATTKEIIVFLDRYMEIHHIESMTPPEANKVLDEAGLLKDRNERSGNYLRKILRSKQIPHAYQDGSGKWHIPHSSKGSANTKSIAAKNKPTDSVKKVVCATSDTRAANVDELMDEKHFRRVKDLSESDIPISSGLYVIMIDDVDVLPNEVSSELKDRNHNILYIGQASTQSSIRKRLWDEELHLKNNATFFRSMGALLGYRPERGSLKENQNGERKSRNYKFGKYDKEQIIHWLEEHILVNYVECNIGIDDMEAFLIRKYKPVINISKNPFKLAYIQNLRDECVAIAYGDK